MPLREPKIHDKIFGTLGRPLSKIASDSAESMGIFSDTTKISWSHFGKKYRLVFNKEEMEYMDLYDTMMKKIYDMRPEFEGLIAYNDHNRHQIIIHNDSDLRNAIHMMKGKLKFYTTLPERGTLSAADIAGRPRRSHSVPPPNSRYSPPIHDHRAPSSLDSNYRTYDRHQRQNTTSFDTSNRYDRSNSFDRRPISRHSPTDSNSSNGRQMNQYNGQMSYPPGYSYNYSSYGNAATPYTQPLLYGMPPSNLLLNHFLTGGHFPLHHHAYAARSGTFIGPNKMLASSWGYPRYGPVW